MDEFFVKTLKPHKAETREWFIKSGIPKHSSKARAKLMRELPEDLKELLRKWGWCV